MKNAGINEIIRKSVLFEDNVFVFWDDPEIFEGTCYYAEELANMMIRIR